MFDRSLLPPALAEFVVLADSHLMLPGGSGSAEFASRSLQTARGEHAFGLIAALTAGRADTPIIHLGDLVQEFPGGPDFERAIDAAREQIARSGLALRLVAGNHDVGDKPDPTSPADWVSPASLDAYHRHFGPSWYSWDTAGLHFVVVNSQILNADLSATAEQAAWLERDLAAHADQPTILFLHLAPFLVDLGEPDLGHYDNVAQPARRWLLDLCRSHQVALVFAGHSHYLFVNRIGPTRFFVTPSVAFTRPGFGEIFSSAPPDERGRNDVAKLGIYLVRVRDDGARVHFIRTNGAASPVDPDAPDRLLLTRVSRDLPTSPLGVVARHPLATVGEVPIAWPSVVRQPMRNDFPWFTCLELGARHLRVPLADLTDPVQRERLAFLRDEGVAITATVLWSARDDLVSLVAPHRDRVDCLEVQLPGAVLPSDASLRQLRDAAEHARLPIALAAVVAREVVAGKQHPRTRIGYRPTELAELDDYLGQRGVVIERVICRPDASASPWESLRYGKGSHLTQIRAVDWIVDLGGGNPLDQLNRTAEAVFGSAHLAGGRLFLDPLLGLDRTMDVTSGLLDRLSNPRPSFHVARCLNSLLFASADSWEPLSAPTVAGARILGARRANQDAWLLLPERADPPVPVELRLLENRPRGARAMTRYDLANGVSRSIDAGSADNPSWIAVHSPTVLVVEQEHEPLVAAPES
jgi:hypothetical protein